MSPAVRRMNHKYADRVRGCRSVAIWSCVAMTATVQALTADPNDTLAVVGRRAILVQEFSRRYQEKVRSVGLTDNVDTRRQYLRNLIDDAVLIEHARRIGLGVTPEARAELERLRTQELLNAYIARHLSPSVKVSNADLRTLYVRLNTSLRVRHLHAPTRERAEALSSALAAGRGFDELARETFKDPWLREHGGSLGVMTVDDMDPEFERVAYALRVGEVSRPVRTARGYSIVRVDELIANPLTTEAEFANAKEQLARFARKRAFEQALKDFTTELRTELGVRFNGALMDKLDGMRRDPAAAEETASRFSASELQSVVVTTTQGPWTLQRVLDELARTPERHKPWIRAKEDLEDMVAGLVLRRHVREESVRQGLDTTEEYRGKVEFGFETFLLERMESRWRSGMVFSADSVRSYYERNKRAFQSPPEVRLSGILLDRKGAADTVRKALMRGEAFGSLAQLHSIQRTTADRDGDMGFFRQEQLGRLGPDLMTLRDGEWKGPFEEEGRFLFVRRTGGKEGSVRPPSDCESEIRMILATTAWPAERRRRVDGLLREIPMEWHPERLPELTFSQRSR